MPNYQDDPLYTPSPDFLDANIAHYRRLLAEQPQLLEYINSTQTSHIIDLAGGIGLFPRIIAAETQNICDISIVEIGAYANSPELHGMLNERLNTSAKVRFQQMGVLEFLKTCTATPDNLLITCVHFIDHLREPHTFLASLKAFALGKNAYLLMYCHTLDSYTGSEWFALNTRTQGEHQIIYSHIALQRLLSEYGTILLGDTHSDDQFILLKLK